MSSSVTVDQQEEHFATSNSQPIDATTSSQQNQSNTGKSENQGPCLKLKGSLVPMTTLELDYFEEEQFTRDLRAKTEQAPGFFDNLPVVIGLEKIDENADLPYGRMIAICSEFSIKIVAIRGGSEAQQTMAKQEGIGVLAKQKERAPSQETAPAEAAKPETIIEQVEVIKEVEVVKTVVQKDRQISKIVHNPIRSGQQVYASDGDLIVLASVSAGAEILADGNIHVYGALRGRALAGVKGDTSARIFCHSLEAELVSVAGQYKISEDIDQNVVKKPSQVYLDQDALCFKEIEL